MSIVAWEVPGCSHPTHPHGHYSTGVKLTNNDLLTWRLANFYRQEFRLNCITFSFIYRILHRTWHGHHSLGHAVNFDLTMYLAYSAIYLEHLAIDL